MVGSTVRPKKSVALLAALGLLAGAVGLTATATASAATEPGVAAPTCPAVQFVSARGSGEPVGMGATLYATYMAFKRQVAAGSSEGVGLRYPAAEVPLINSGTTWTEFNDSINVGIAHLKTHLTDQSARCPGQGFVIAGYSQGAIVADTALNQLPVSITQRVKAVALFGDPRFNPTFAGNQAPPNDEEGILRTVQPNYGGPNYIAPTLASRTQSYCLDGDPVCHFSMLNLLNCTTTSWTGSSCPHSDYKLAEVNKAATFLAQKAVS